MLDASLGMADARNVLHFTVRAEPDAPAVLRERLRALDRLAEGLRLDLELLISELVANAVRHAEVGTDEPIDVRIRIDPGRVRVEVRDRGRGVAGFPQRPVRRPTAGSTTGYGLYLVDRIASEWGATQDHGTTVWFELQPDD